MVKIMDDINRDSTTYILARIEEKLDTALRNNEEHRKEDDKRFEEQGSRIGKLETAKAIVVGALIVLSILFSGDKVVALANAIR